MNPVTLSPRQQAAARVRAEGGVPIEEAALLFKLSGGRTASPGSLKRWIASGKSGVKLDGLKSAGKLYTSFAAVQRFRKATGL